MKWIKKDWHTQLGKDFDALQPFLQRTKDKAHSYPCDKGCLREIRTYANKIYGICTNSDESCCDNIELSDEEITLYSLNIEKLADVIIKHLSDLPLNKSIAKEDSHSLTYHVATYDENDEYSRSLSVYFSLFPQHINNIELSNIFTKRPDFVILTLSNINLNTLSNAFAQRIIKLDSTILLKKLNAHAQLNLAKRLSEILVTTTAPAFSEPVLKDYAFGKHSRLKQQNNARRRANDIKDQTEERYEKPFDLALYEIEKATKNTYSASSLAESLIKKYKLKISKRQLRKKLGEHPEILKLLKPHHKKK